MLLGRPVIDYTFNQVHESRMLNAALLTTDSVPAKALARTAGIEVVDRPAELAGDKATVDAAARHAVETWERLHGQSTDIVVLLYGNIPVRPAGLIDRAIEHLRQSGADSVRSVARVTKQHPDWVHRLDGDRMSQFRPNCTYRRQDLDPLYYHDGAVAAVTRRALFGARPDDHQSFLGEDRRAIVCEPEDAVDIDGPIDLALAEAILRTRKPSTTESPMPPKGLCIGSHTIGPDQRVFVIAEAGVNHNGDVETALQMVDVAAKAGADAIKFQLFRAGDLATRGAATAGYQRGTVAAATQQEMLSQLELCDEAFERSARRCREKGILFLGTPFGLREVQRLIALGAPAIKIASTDLTNDLLLKAAVDAGIPLIVSTGAATPEEVDECVAAMQRWRARERLILLHCISAYPTPIDAANLRAIATLGRRYAGPVGFSDHTTSTSTGALAVMAGACVLEKHFTLDPAMPGPDHRMSLAPDGLRAYIAAVREAELARGAGRLGLCAAEQDVRIAARRSVVAQQPIARGMRITREMLTVKRPGTGIPPRELDRLVGCTAACDIPHDAMISWDMVR
jgi:N-acetylneuraminate synthase/N,N'-diacetyllegionaminate synthase